MPDYVDAAVCTFCGSTLERDQVRVSLEETRQGAQRQPLRSVRCSQCAGPLSACEGKRVLVCDHCGVRVAVLEPGGLTHWHFPARVDRAGALAAGAAWLKDYPGIAAEVREAEPSEVKLAYAPIWEHRVLTAGWEFGPDPAWFIEARLNHISNGGLDDENTGVNSVQFMLGRYF